MALLIKMETEVEIKATAEQFYHLFILPPPSLPICSDIVAVEIHDGKWCDQGSTRKWTYKFSGKSETFKEKIDFDYENKKVTHVGLDGDMFKYYKIFKGSFQAVPKAGGGEGAIVKVVIEYEKLNKDMPSPENYLELLVVFVKEKDAHLSKA